MGSKKKIDGVENVYAAAQKWVDCALRDDGSLFTPGKRIWTREWLGKLRECYLDRPDVAGDGFYDKLRNQLQGSRPEVYQLMAEVLYTHFLVIWHGAGGMRSDTKQERINRVFEWSDQQIAIPENLATGLTPGIAAVGAGQARLRPFMVGFLIDFVDQWKEQEPDRHQRLLDEPWRFKDFTTRLELRGQLFREGPSSHLPQQEALLHLLFPDTFEGIVSLDHKEKIVGAKAFAHFLTEKTSDVDRKLAQVRSGLEKERKGRNFDFYDSDILARWDSSFNPWDEFIKRAKAIVDSGDLDSGEVDYKVDISRKLGVAREAVLTGDEDWPNLLTQALEPNHPISWRTLDNFRGWYTDNSDMALSALRRLWAEETENNPSIPERIRTFAREIPTEVATVGSVGTRTTIVSALLMGLDAKKYPWYQTRAYHTAYNLVGYGNPKSEADEAALYVHALGFLDRLIEEASKRELTLRHRLDAQSVLWYSQDEEILPPVPPPLPSHLDLDDLAEQLFLPVTFLEEIETLLNDKRKPQVIFQGPPGTGKTYVAQALAEHLAGSEERVTLVQFHPSYAYEDFVQGFRPNTGEDGQPRFELKDGPLRQVAKRAEDEPGEKHFLIIDEINRGQLSKVLGELYFLLEYRDKEMRLQYSDKPFSLPENLYIIGTMNTADRSIALVDAALRRRFYFVEFHPDDEPVRGVLRLWLQTNHPNMEWVANVVERANELLKDDRHAAIGPSYFMKDRLNGDMVERIWKHSVIPYIEERLFEDPEHLKKFALPKLRGMDGGAVEQDAQLEENGESDNSETTQHVNEDTAQSEDQRQ